LIIILINFLCLNIAGKKSSRRQQKGALQQW